MRKKIFNYLLLYNFFFTKGENMVPIFGVEIDVISLTPALFGAVLSIYNFYKMSKPANIEPTEIINYGIISSSYEQSFKIILPLVFHNDGAKKGIIKNVKFGFRNGQRISYVNNLFKIRLNELSDDIAQLCDWNKFIDQGYRILNPTYPITVLSDTSIDVTFIATASVEEDIIPIDTKCEYFIEIFYGNNKIKKKFLPFFLAKDDIPDDRLIWLSL